MAIPLQSPDSDNYNVVEITDIGLHTNELFIFDYRF